MRTTTSQGLNWRQWRKTISRLIDDIDRLDINRRNMMDELKVLRDVTLFYNEANPELRAAAKKPVTEDAERDEDSGNTTPESPLPQRCRRHR